MDVSMTMAGFVGPYALLFTEDQRALTIGDDQTEGIEATAFSTTVEPTWFEVS